MYILSCPYIHCCLNYSYTICTEKDAFVRRYKVIHFVFNNRTKFPFRCIVPSLVWCHHMHSNVFKRFRNNDG